MCDFRWFSVPFNYLYKINFIVHILKYLESSEQVGLLHVGFVIFYNFRINFPSYV